MVLACTIWGISPLYYKLLADIPAPDVLAHRTLWSAVFFTGVLALRGMLPALWDSLRGWARLGRMALAALFISINWFFFIYAIQIGRATEASLGYYIFPLVAVVMGMAVFGERPSRWQLGAVGLAAVAVGVLTLGLGVAPWISLLLAFSFGAYGVMKKGLKVNAIASVTAEVWILAPLALGWLALVQVDPGARSELTAGQVALLLGSGPLTALPLILFSAASKQVSMGTLGLVQYLNPTLQFLCAVLIFGEAFTGYHAVAFGLIWAALALYSATAVGVERARRKSAMAAALSDAHSVNPRSEGAAKPSSTT